MKFFLPIILLICATTNAQNADCLQFGETLSIKIDSICLSVGDQSTKPTITIIDYGTLPVRGDTSKYSKFGGSSRVFRVNDRILKLVYTGVKEENNGLKNEKVDIQIFFDQDKPLYIDYKLVTFTNNKKVIDLRLFFCIEELTVTNDSLNIESIIKQINRLVDDARN